MECKILDCHNESHSRGWCSKHYSRWRRTGDPTGSTYRKSKYDPVCTLKECKNNHHSGGLCGIHYKNLVRYGDPRITYEDIRTCSSDTCYNLMPKDNFWCSACYNLIKNGMHPKVLKSKSGWILDSHGYVQLYFRKPTSKASVKHHRIVMENFLNRKLYSYETVHHRNGDRQDNRPENLELWCKKHVPGQRTEDLVEYAIWILNQYVPQYLDKLCDRTRRNGI